MGTVSAVCRKAFRKKYYGRDLPAGEMSPLLVDSSVAGSVAPIWASLHVILMLHVSIAIDSKMKQLLYSLHGLIRPCFVCRVVDPSLVSGNSLVPPDKIQNSSAVVRL